MQSSLNCTSSTTVVVQKIELRINPNLLLKQYSLLHNIIVYDDVKHPAAMG